MMTMPALEDFSGHPADWPDRCPPGCAKCALDYLSAKECSGCGTDLDEDGACPCCEGARA